MTVDLNHNVVSGFEHGFQDILARPDAARSRGSRGIPRWRGASPTSSGWTARPFGVRLARRC